MAKLLTVDDNGYTDIDNTLDLDAVKECLDKFISKAMQINVLGERFCIHCTTEKGNPHYSDCPVSKATTILKQLESIKEEVK